MQVFVDNSLSTIRGTCVEGPTCLYAIVMYGPATSFAPPPPSLPPAPPLDGLYHLPRASASMSSTYGQDWSASVCADNVQTPTSGNCCCHTNTEADPWLRIDMGGTYEVTYVQIYNRDDNGCASRLGTFELWLISASGERSRCAVERF